MKTLLLLTLLLLSLSACAMSTDETEDTPDVDVALDTEGLTLIDSFTFINNENGAEIWRSVNSWDALRCFVMGEGSHTDNAYWSIALFGSTGTRARHGAAEWRCTGGTPGVTCALQFCNLNTGVCKSSGTLWYTSDPHTIFTTIAPAGSQPWAKITCMDNGGGISGHPILKRYL